MGPLGFEPRTDGLKVSGSSLKTAPKQPQKPGNCRFQAKRARNNAGFRPPSRYKMATMATPKKRGKCRPQAKRARVC